MSWVSGDLITATKLNTENESSLRTYTYGHQGWSWRTSDIYFLCTRTANDDTSAPLVNTTHSTSSGNQKKLTLWRRENGEWVQKKYSDTASGSKTINFDSYGIGQYKFRLNDHNNTPTLKVRCVSFNNTSGNYLKATSIGPYTIDSEDVCISAAISQPGAVLSADSLNEYRVYTE